MSARNDGMPKLQSELQEYLGSLSYRDRGVIEMLYGLGDHYFYSKEEVAKVWGVSPHMIVEIDTRIRDQLAKKELLHALPKRPSSK